MSDRQIFEIDLKYEFSGVETEELGKRLAAAEKEREDLEAEKKQITSTLGSQIKEVQARIKADSDKLNQGFEIRKVPVYTKIDLEAKVKRFYRAEDDEFIKEEPLPKNYQAGLYDNSVTDLPFDDVEEDDDQFSPMNEEEIQNAEKEVNKKTNRKKKAEAEEA